MNSKPRQEHGVLRESCSSGRSPLAPDEEHLGDEGGVSQEAGQDGSVRASVLLCPGLHDKPRDDQPKWVSANSRRTKGLWSPSSRCKLDFPLLSQALEENFINKTERLKAHEIRRTPHPEEHAGVC